MHREGPRGRARNGSDHRARVGEGRPVPDEGLRRQDGGAARAWTRGDPEEGEGRRSDEGARRPWALGARTEARHAQEAPRRGPEARGCVSRSRVGRSQDREVNGYDGTVRTVWWRTACGVAVAIA